MLVDFVVLSLRGGCKIHLWCVRGPCSGDEGARMAEETKEARAYCGTQMEVTDDGTKSMLKVVVQGLVERKTTLACSEG
jgi:hypothetical protein